MKQRAVVRRWSSKKVPSPRSRTSREVQGFLPGWLATEAEAEETNKTVIYIAEQGQKHESCQENVRMIIIYL